MLTTLALLMMTALAVATFKTLRDETRAEMPLPATADRGH